MPKRALTTTPIVAHHGDAVFLAALKAYGIPAPQPEWPFAWATQRRKWRFDFAWVAEHVALEVDGAVWVRGRHTRGAGYIKDIEKMNAAMCLGWRVLKTTPDKLTAPETLDAIAVCLNITRSA